MITVKPDLLYSKSNEWIEILDDFIRVGIDDYSQSSLGDIVHVELLAPENYVQAGNSFGHIEATKSVTDINAPVSGVILKINKNVITSPDLINYDPYGSGWLIEMKPDNISELDKLMNSNSYKNYIFNDSNSRFN